MEHSSTITAEPKKTLDLRLLVMGTLCLAIATFTVAGIASSSQLAAQKSEADLKKIERLVDQIASSKADTSQTDIAEFGHSSEVIAAAKKFARITDQQTRVFGWLSSDLLRLIYLFNRRNCCGRQYHF